MSDLDRFKDKVFGKKSKQEKLDDFEAGSVKAVLRDIGWTTGQIREAEAEFDVLTWHWFNTQALIPPRVGSARIFTFNINELVEQRDKHPIVKAFRELADEEPGDSSTIVLIFKLGEKRWVATDFQIAYDSCIRVTSDWPTLSVLPFKSFFKRWSDTNGEE